MAALGEITTKATGLMGLGVQGSKRGPAFGRDVLRITITGRTGLNLSVVDLPGLISVPSDLQNIDDVKTVHSIVDGYMKEDRIIILAVVQASNDLANQSVVQKAKEFDKTMSRTVCIITKPDMINPGAEAEIAALVNGQGSIKLKLGFFVLKNPSTHDGGSSLITAQRELIETEWLKQGRWQKQKLQADRVGVVSLKPYLAALLDDHTSTELPKVKEAITTKQRETEAVLVKLGDARSTTSDIRLHLTKIASRFVNIITATSKGNYNVTEPKFFKVTTEPAPPSRRMQAYIHRTFLAFATVMNESGMWKKVSRQAVPSKVEGILSIEHVTDSDMIQWIRSVHAQSRGAELPGNFNHILLEDLYHLQTQRWRGLATKQVTDMFTAFLNAINTVLMYLEPEVHVHNAIFQLVIKAKVDLMKEQAMKDLDLLCIDNDGALITYNHYYSDTIQKAREERLQQAVEASRTTSRSTPGGQRVIVDMDEQACSEARVALDAIYKVNCKRFVDNIAVQVIHRNIVSLLPSLFTPEHICAMTDAEIKKIGSEKQDTIEKTAKHQELQKQLAQGLALLSQDLK